MRLTDSSPHQHQKCVHTRSYTFTFPQPAYGLRGTKNKIHFAIADSMWCRCATCMRNALHIHSSQITKKLTRYTHFHWQCKPYTVVSFRLHYHFLIDIPSAQELPIPRTIHVPTRVTCIVLLKLHLYIYFFLFPYKFWYQSYAAVNANAIYCVPDFTACAVCHLCANRCWRYKHAVLQ